MLKTVCFHEVFRESTLTHVILNLLWASTLNYSISKLVYQKFRDYGISAKGCLLILKHKLHKFASMMSQTRFPCSSLGQNSEAAYTASSMRLLMRTHHW